jgi:hypothetical protein
MPKEPSPRGRRAPRSARSQLRADAGTETRTRRARRRGSGEDRSRAGADHEAATGKESRGQESKVHPGEGQSAVAGCYSSISSSAGICRSF